MRPVANQRLQVSPASYVYFMHTSHFATCMCPGVVGTSEASPDLSSMKLHSLWASKIRTENPGGFPQMRKISRATYQSKLIPHK